MEEHLSLILGSLTLLGLIFGFGDKIFKRGSKERGIEDRVKELEDNDCEIHKKLDRIMNNELVHINADIKSINEVVIRIDERVKILLEK